MKTTLALGLAAVLLGVACGGATKSARGAEVPAAELPGGPGPHELLLWSPEGGRFELLLDEEGASLDGREPWPSVGEGRWQAEVMWLESLDECSDHQDALQALFSLTWSGATASFELHEQLLLCDESETSRVRKYTLAPPAHGRICKGGDEEWDHEDHHDRPLATDHDCDGTLLVDDGSGYAVEVYWKEGDRWEGEQEFMSHPPHTRRYAIRWTPGEQTLEVVAYDEEWEVWDEPNDLDYCLDECSVVCVDDCVREEEGCDPEDLEPGAAEGDPCLDSACHESCLDTCETDCRAEIDEMELDSGLEEEEGEGEGEEPDPATLVPGRYLRLPGPLTEGAARGG